MDVECVCASKREEKKSMFLFYFLQLLIANVVGNYEREAARNGKKITACKQASKQT